MSDFLEPQTEEERLMAERMARIAAVAEKKMNSKMRSEANGAKASIPQHGEDNGNAEQLLRMKDLTGGQKAYEQKAYLQSNGVLDVDESETDMRPARVSSSIKFVSKKERERLKQLEEKKTSERRQKEMERSKALKALEAKKLKEEAERERKRKREDSRSSHRKRGSRSHDHRTTKEGGKMTKRLREDRSTPADMNRDMIKEIKNSYLGVSAAKKKSGKMNEKGGLRFKFAWDEEDDTSRDLNPLYANKAEASFLFGRGRLAGLDATFNDDSSHDYLRAVQKKRAELNIGSVAKTSEERQDGRSKQRRRKHMNRYDLGLSGKNWRDKSLSEMTERDWRIFREDYEIFLSGGSNALRQFPKPLRGWSDLIKSSRKDGWSPISEDLYEAIRKLDHKKPTPVQMQCIPVGLTQRDLIGVAETGSGKTLSFLVPLFNYLENQPEYKFQKLSEDGPMGLILAPTRELAQQITDEAVRVIRRYPSSSSVSISHSRSKASSRKSSGSEKARFRFVCIVGGSGIEAQGTSLRAGCDVIVGTPGRLIDCIDSRYLVFNQCDYVVLDEADTMIDMGFEPQVEYILEKLNNVNPKADTEEEVMKQEKQAANGTASYRTTIMFSATMPKSVENLARKYMKYPAMVRIGDRDASRNQKIEQVVVMCSEPQKPARLKAAVGNTAPPVLVFVNARSSCKAVGNMLESYGYKVKELHAGKTQAIREENLSLFKERQVEVLVATDVASRGLDISNIQHVINYDMPSSIERYTHRIGRTGRAGKSGLATTLLTENDEQLYKDLYLYLSGTNSAIPKGLEKHSTVKDHLLAGKVV